MDQIDPDEDQPRDQFDPEKLEELSRSIQAHGIIQPITVCRTEDGRYRIVAGERRWRAAKMAGLGAVPALVRTLGDDDPLEIALIENIQREDLNPLEIAAAFDRLAGDFRMSHEDIARKTGKDRTTVTNFLRLLRLSKPVKQELLSGGITMGHARALLNVADITEQAQICAAIKERGLSVRQTEAWTKQVAERQKGAQPNETKRVKAAYQPDANTRAAVDEMAAALGTRVALVPKSSSEGRLEIEYYSLDDLERIYSAIVRTA